MAPVSKLSYDQGEFTHTKLQDAERRLDYVGGVFNNPPDLAGCPGTAAGCPAGKNCFKRAPARGL